MDGEGVKRIHQLLLLEDVETLESVGPALWTMFEEVEKLYNLTAPLATFQRTCLATDVPASVADRIDPDDLMRLSGDQWDALWAGCQGSFAETIDQDRMVEQLGLALEPSDKPLGNAMILTDQEMTPPKEWRYVLFQMIGSSAVVSLAPMDPLYWGIEDQERLSTLKHRARAGCMCVTGMALGLERCENEQCYLFGSVDSVLRLDLMRTIGAEHAEFPSDDAVGFPTQTADPAAEQDVLPREKLEIEGWPSL